MVDFGYDEGPLILEEVCAAAQNFVAKKTNRKKRQMRKVKLLNRNERSR